MLNEENRNIEKIQIEKNYRNYDLKHKKQSIKTRKNYNKMRVGFLPDNFSFFCPNFCQAFQDLSSGE